MNAEQRVIEYLKGKGADGALQSEIHRDLKLSKSTVSEILQKLEESGEIVREKIAGKAYRVWFFEFAPKPVEGIVRIGILKASEYPHVLLATESLKEKVYIKIFDNALDLTKALSSLQIDIGCSPFVTQTMFALLLKSIKIHCIVAYNGSGVILKKNLKDCRVFATSELSAMESNLKLFLERSGMDISKLSFKYPSTPENMIESFRNCEFDAMAIWEPYFTMMNSKYEHIEFKEAIGDFPCCSLASNVEFYESRGDTLKEYLEELRRATEELERESKRRDASKIIAKKIGFNQKLVLKSFDSYVFSAELTRDVFRFLENYGLKLTEESVKKIV